MVGTEVGGLVGPRGVVCLVGIGLRGSVGPRGVVCLVGIGVGGLVGPSGGVRLGRLVGIRAGGLEGGIVVGGGDEFFWGLGQHHTLNVVWFMFKTGFS